MRFRDRAEAGGLLADKLRDYAGCSYVVVVALPRGGVPGACEIARALDVPLDIFLVRKLGVAGHEELALGASLRGSSCLAPASSGLYVAVVRGFNHHL